MIKQLSSVFPLVKLCKVMKVSRSAYYALPKRTAKIITAEQLHLYRTAKVNLICGLIAYTFQEKQPSIRITRLDKEFLMQL